MKRVLFLGKDPIWMIPSVAERLRNDGMKVITENQFIQSKPNLVRLLPKVHPILLSEELATEEFDLVIIEDDDRNLRDFVPKKLRLKSIIFQKGNPSLETQIQYQQRFLYSHVLSRRNVIRHLEQHGAVLPQ